MAKTVHRNSATDKALATVVAGELGADKLLNRVQGWSISRSSGELDILTLRVVLLPGEVDAALKADRT